MQQQVLLEQQAWLAGGSGAVVEQPDPCVIHQARLGAASRQPGMRSALQAAPRWSLAAARVGLGAAAQWGVYASPAGMRSAPAAPGSVRKDRSAAVQGLQQAFRTLGRQPPPRLHRCRRKFAADPGHPWQAAGPAPFPSVVHRCAAAPSADDEHFSAQQPARSCPAAKPVIRPSAGAPAGVRCLCAAAQHPAATGAFASPRH